jgi:hypothetical protein
VETEEMDTESGFSATRFGMLKALQNGHRLSKKTTGNKNDNIDSELLDEFATEVKKMMANVNAQTADK